MKKWLKVLLWILGIILLLGIGAYWYMTYILLQPIHIHFCPLGYYPTVTLSNEGCNDCELTRKQIINGETATYNDECRTIRKECYLCWKPAPKDCQCLDEPHYIKIH